MRYSLTYSLTYSMRYSLTYSVTYSMRYSLTYSLTPTPVIKQSTNSNNNLGKVASCTAQTPSTPQST